jgi:hypothetical protein
MTMIKLLAAAIITSLIWFMYVEISDQPYAPSQVLDEKAP